MALRLMQIFLPHVHMDEVNELLEGRDILGRWHDTELDQTVLHLLVPAEETEPIMDQFEQRYSGVEHFHVVLCPVDAVLPRLEVKPPEDEPPVVEPDTEGNRHRISREELYANANESLDRDRVFLGLTILSAVVAAIGLMRNDVAVIIGAMVIAPLLGPNVAMALATTLGDTALLRRALMTNFVGIMSVFAFAMLVGMAIPINAEVPAIAARTSTDFGDVLLAFAAGMAGTLAFTRGQAGAVIGVMVAVALVPPVVTCGMLFGSGQTYLAFGAFLLASTNVICINLAGVVTFLLQGVRPRSWWEAEHAKKRVREAVLTWTILLAVLILVLWLSRYSGAVRHPGPEKTQATAAILGNRGHLLDRSMHSV